MALKRNGTLTKHMILHNGKMLKLGYHNGNKQIWASGNVVVYHVDTSKVYTKELTYGESCLDPVGFVPEKDGWTFIGWREDKVAAQEVLTAKTMGTEPITLYAVYKKSVTLSYNGNGETGGSVDSQTKMRYYNGAGIFADPTFTLAANGFTRKGYSFSKWNLGEAGAAIVLQADAVAQAEWTSNAFTWVSNYVGTGEILLITILSEENLDYNEGDTLTEFKVVPTIQDEEENAGGSFETNKVSTRGCKYMNITFDYYNSSRNTGGEMVDYFQVRSQDGTVLKTLYPAIYQYTVQVDVSSAEKVDIYCKLGAWAYNQSPFCKVSAISFSN